jgi:hypothetical protein
MAVLWTSLLSLRRGPTPPQCPVTHFSQPYGKLDYLLRDLQYYFNFSPNSEKHIKAVIDHIPPDMPAEDISNSLEDLGFNVINMRQMTATRRAPVDKTTWNSSLGSLLP